MSGVAESSLGNAGSAGSGVPYSLQRSEETKQLEALVFSASARGRGEHKVGAKQLASEAVLRKAELAANRTVIPLLSVLRKLTSRGNLDTEVDASLVFGQLERLRHLRDDAVVFNASSAANVDADPALSLRVRQFMDLVTAFGFAVQPNGGQVEFEALKDVIDLLEVEFAAYTSDTRRQLAADGTLEYLGLQEVYHIGDVVACEVGSLGGSRVAFRVNDAYYEHQRSVYGTVKKKFHLALEFVGSIGDDHFLISFEEVLDDWQESRSISSLIYRPVVDAAELQALAGRGEAALRLAFGHHYRQYRAGCFFPHRGPRMLASGGGPVASGAGMVAPSSSVLASAGKIVVDAGRGLSLGYSSAPGFDNCALAFQQTSRQVGVIRRASTTGAESGETDYRRRERMRSAGLRVLDRVPT